MHEKVLVFANFRPVTWDELILMTLNELGGTAETLTNPAYQATVRRTLQEEAKQVNLGKWTKDGR